jgi:hypothetical protein
MSNSVVFLLIAVGLSILGSLVVWVHGRPRRPRSSVDHFNAGLRALSSSDTRREPLSGVTVRVSGMDDAEDVEPETDAMHDVEHEQQPAPRSQRPSPRPSPRPARPSREGTRPGA